ncbi:MAG: polysaccharide lyase [Dermatophilaceae bacterium]
MSQSLPRSTRPAVSRRALIGGGAASLGTAPALDGVTSASAAPSASAATAASLGRSGAAASSAALPSSLSVDFQNWQPGQVYGLDQVTSDWGPEVEYLISTAPAQVLEFQDDEMHRLRVTFPAGEYGADGKFQFESRLEARRRYRMSYRVLFEQGFQFNRGNDTETIGGGKLPGLGGGTLPAGGSDDPNGMSLRLMWRGDNGSGGSGGDTWRHYLETYHYWQGKTDPQWGDRTLLLDVVEQRWYQVDIDLDLGTTTSDGRLTVSIDDVVLYDRAHRYLVSDATWSLDTAFFALFYGGNEAFWAPTEDTSLLLDDFVITAV